MENKSWFAENGSLNEIGKQNIEAFKEEVQELLTAAMCDNMRRNDLLILQSNLFKLIGDKINELMINND